MRLSSSSLVIARARISCSVRSAKRFTGRASLFRTTINKDAVGANRAYRDSRSAAKSKAPLCSGKREEMSPDLKASAMRHRSERRRHIGVAEVHIGGPGERPLAAGEIDHEGQHGSHRSE